MKLGSMPKEKLLHRFLYRLTSEMPMRLISIQNQPYLERYHVAKIFGIKVWIHHFVRSDEERHVHDHPWSALSIILLGGYVEQIVSPENVSKLKTRKSIGVNWIPWKKRHRIVKVSVDTWSLMIVGPRTGKGWYFYGVDPRTGGPLKTEGTSGGENWHLTAKTRQKVYSELRNGN